MPCRPRFFTLLLAFCLYIPLFSACSASSTASPTALLEAMCAAECPLPAGRIYVRSAPQDSDSHLGDELLAMTFGNGALPPEIDEVTDAAIFLSYTNPCELAVFRCKTADGTDAVAAMCLRRLDFLKTHRIDQNSETDAYLCSARVTVWGKWVIFTVSSDPDAALRALKRVA